MVEKIAMRLKVCIEHCNYFRKNGKQYWKHLSDYLARARDKKNSKWE